MKWGFMCKGFTKLKTSSETGHIFRIDSALMDYNCHFHKTALVPTTSLVSPKRVAGARVGVGLSHKQIEKLFVQNEAE